MTWMRALAFALAIFAVAPASAETILTVSGEGSVLSQPDMAVISLQVSRQAPTAQAATRAVGAAAQDVLALLQAEGIAERDVQTGSLQLNPVWDRHATNEEPRVIGYSAGTSFDVRVRDLDRFGAVLDAVVSEGANGFRGFRFAMQEPRPAEDAARRAAFEDAMAKAALYAQAAGLRLGEIRTIREGGAGQVPIRMEAMAMRTASDAIPIAGGELSIQMQVTLEIVLVP